MSKHNRARVWYGSPPPGQERQTPRPAAQSGSLNSMLRGDSVLSEAPPATGIAKQGQIKGQPEVGVQATTEPPAKRARQQSPTPASANSKPPFSPENPGQRYRNHPHDVDINAASTQLSETGVQQTARTLTNSAISDMRVSRRSGLAATHSNGYQLRDHLNLRLLEHPRAPMSRIGASYTAKTNAPSPHPEADKQPTAPRGTKRKFRTAIPPPPFLTLAPEREMPWRSPVRIAWADPTHQISTHPRPATSQLHSRCISQSLVQLEPGMESSPVTMIALPLGGMIELAHVYSDDKVTRAEA
ncbi:hypothetical protein B0A55_08518 [Friedmanniomyces simplex]|uniref:Uncharacterized protein n=1 Tax=Friedmanniomyces simplex TaxID=329884 RepID=A0A4U0X109_9PEZI|nr:hypothetical protein B0A55_08518 [Friedmanniomyces simplex]